MARVQVLGFAEGLVHAVLLRRRFGGGGVFVHDRHDVRPGGPEPRHVIGRHPARSDDRNLLSHR